MRGSELDLFADLGHPNDLIRLKSGQKLLSILQRDQSVSCLVYTVRRLIQGLGGTKLRAGCFATFGSLLQIIPHHVLSFEILDAIIQKVLVLPKNFSKKDVGHTSLGELLAYGALIITNYLQDETREVKETIALRLINIAQKKSYLHHTAFLYLSKITVKYKLECLPEGFKSHIMNLEEFTLDKLYFLLCLNSFSRSELIKMVFDCNSGDMIDDKVVCQIASLLMKKSSLLSMDHPFYNLFSIKLALDVNKVKLFWETITEDSATTSQKKALIILHIMNHILKYVTEEDFVVDVLLNKTVIHILNERGRKESIAKDILKKVISIAKHGASNINLQLIKHILFDTGCLSFDNTTGSRLCYQLLNNLDFHGVKKLGHIFKKNLKDDLNKFDGETWTSKEKLIVFTYYNKLLTRVQLLHNAKSVEFSVCNEWRIKQLIFILDVCLFADAKGNVNAELSGLMRNSFFNTLGNVYPNVASHRIVLAELVRFTHTKIKSGSTLRVKLKPEDLSEWNNMVTWSFDMSENMANDIQEILQILSFYMALNAFRHPKISLLNLKDIKEIYHINDTKGDHVNCDGFHWTEIMGELFLNLLSEPVSGHRSLVCSLFKSVLKYFNGKSHLRLLYVLDPDKEICQNGSNGDDIESESENSDMDEDNEIPDYESDNKKSLINEEDSSVSDLDNALNSCKDDHQNMSYENDINNFSEEDCLSSQFQTSTICKSDVYPAEKKSEKIDDDEDSDNVSFNLEDLNESEINRLNQLVGEIFRECKLKMRKKKSTPNDLTHFRIRVLDLIEICCKENSYLTVSYWLVAIPVLVKLFKLSSRQESETALYNRLGSCIKKICLLPIQSLQATQEHIKQILSILKVLLELVSSGSSKHYKDHLLSLIKLLLKISNPFVVDGKEEGNEIIEVIATSFKDFFRSSHSIPFSFFSYLCEIRWHGMHKLLHIASKWTFNSEIKMQRRIFGLQLLEIFFSKEYYINNVSSSDLKKFERHFCKLKMVTSSNTDLWEKFLFRTINLLRLLYVKGLGTNLDWNGLSRTLNGVIGKTPSKNIQKLLNELTEFSTKNQGFNIQLLQHNPYEESNVMETEIEQNSVTKKRKISSKLLKKRSKKLRLQAVNMDNYEQNFNELSVITQ